MRYTTCFLVSCLFIIGFTPTLPAQDKQIIPVSPAAAALAKMVNYPVNLNTGIPNINIPFYEIQVGDLTLPVNLVYHGGGFKTNEHATRAGLGWSLSSNLQITRTINGLDDFQSGDGYIENTLMKAYDPSNPYGYLYPLWSTSPWPSKNAYDLAAGVKDGEPDKFNYNLLDKSGSFYFMKNTAGTGYTIVPVPYDNIKITYNNGQFIIVDTDGTTYYFGEQGTGDVDDMPSLGKELTGSIDLMAGTCMNCKVTGWKCMRIESSTSTNTINFTYQAQTVTKYRSYSDRIEYYDNESPCGIGDYYHSNEFPLNTYNSYENIIQNKPFYQISSPKYMVYFGNGQPIFHVPSFDAQGNMTDVTYEKNNYSHGSGMDIAGLALSQIEFRGGKVVFYGSDHLSLINVSDDDNHTIKSAYLYQSYTNAYYTQEAQFYNGSNFQGTSYLDSLHIENGGNTYERYAFLYNDKFCYGNHLKGHDAWGYPNGSTVEIAYANNTFGNILSIPSKRLTLGRYYFDIQGGCTNTIEDLPIEIGGDDWAEAPDEEDMKKGTLKRIIYPTGGFVDFDWEANKYLESFDNGYNPQKLPLQGGGLRIRSISYFDGKNLLPNMQKYYRYGDLEDGTGILINRPRHGLESGTYHYEAVDYDQQVAYLSAPDVPTCYNRGCLSVKTLETKTTFQPASALNYTYENGAPIYYTKVTIYKKDLGVQSGKTVYEYYPPDEFMDYPAFLQEENRIPETPLSYLKTDGLMGAEKSESQYKYDSQNGYQLVHRKSFEYDRFLKDQAIRVAYAFFHVLYELVEGNYQNSNSWGLYDNTYSFSSSPYLENEYIANQYNIPVGKLLLNKVTEQTFEGSNVLTQTSEYHYDNPSYLQPSRIEYSSSKGDYIVKEIKYPYDFSGIYSQMVSANMIDLPIEVTETNESVPEGEEISKKKTNYDHIQEGPGFYAPVSVQTSYGGGPLTTDATFDKYDQYGNILQRTLRNGIPVSYLWGYDSLYPVAELTGVKYSQIPSSFLSNAQINDPSSDGALRSVLDNLRSSFNGNERISTYTYKRLTGITSGSTANHYTTYYEYDPLGRLIDQKDNDQHVIKSYSYNMVGPSSYNMNTWYVNYPMMETHDQDCGGGHYAVYNYIVPGGKYAGSSQEMVNYQAKNDINGSYYPPVPSPCSTADSFATATLELTGIYDINSGYPDEVIIDFLQNGSIVASAHVPYNPATNQNFQSVTLRLLPGEYQLSLRPSADTRYTNAFLTFDITAVEENYYLYLQHGDSIDIKKDKHYEIYITNIM